MLFKIPQTYNMYFKMEMATTSKSTLMANYFFTSRVAPIKTDTNKPSPQVSYTLLKISFSSLYADDSLYNLQATKAAAPLQSQHW